MKLFRFFPKYRQGQLVFLKDCRDENENNLALFITGRVWGPKIKKGRRWYYHGEVYSLGNPEDGGSLEYRRTTPQWFSEDDFLD